MSKCPICEHATIVETALLSVQGELGTFPIVECAACGHRFLAEPPDAATLADFYDRYYAAEHGSPRARPWPRDRVLAFQLARRLPRGARILDIGANYGSTLRAMPRHFRREGVETSRDAAASASRDAAIKIHHMPIEDVRLPAGAYDAVLALAVIEHLRSPLDLTRTMARLVRPEGVAVLMTGDTQTWRARAQGSRWQLYHSLGHLHFFSALSLELCLHRAGFEVERRLWTGPTPRTARLPARLGRLLHSQASSLLAAELRSSRPQGDHLYMWAHRRPSAS